MDIRVRQLQPDVVFLDTSSNTDTAIALITFLSRANSPVAVVAIDKERNSDHILQVLRAGASEFLYAPFDSRNTIEALARFSGFSQPESSGDTAAACIVAFSNVKPGCGSTMLAMQTAMALKQKTGKRILLADLDAAGGAIGMYLRLDPEFSFLEALEMVEFLNPESWTSVLSAADGIDVLPASFAAQASEPESGPLQMMLEYARTMYDWIVLDLPGIFQRTSLVTIAQADRAFLVSTSELPSLHLARKSITMLEQLGYPNERFEVVINRANKRHGIGRSDIERILRCPVHSSLPNDYFSIHRALTLGQALAPQSELGKAIDDFAGQISGNAGRSKKNTALAADKK